MSGRTPLESVIESARRDAGGVAHARGQRGEGMRSEKTKGLGAGVGAAPEGGEDEHTRPIALCGEHPVRIGARVGVEQNEGAGRIAGGTGGLGLPEQVEAPERRPEAAVASGAEAGASACEGADGSRRATRP